MQYFSVFRHIFITCVRIRPDLIFEESIQTGKPLVHKFMLETSLLIKEYIEVKVVSDSVQVSLVDLHKDFLFPITLPKELELSLFSETVFNIRRNSSYKHSVNAVLS